jgi:hypothetical protein
MVLRAISKLPHTKRLLILSKGSGQEREPSKDSGGFDTQLSQDMMQA